MTTVVALARDGAVAMAADTCINVYERPIVGGAHKLLRLGVGASEALLGFAGEGAGPGIVATMWNVGVHPDDDEDPQSWANDIAIAVTTWLKNAGLVRDERIDATMLFGWRGRLWTLTHMVAIPHDDGVAAIGSGEGPAIGAVDAMLAVGADLSSAEIVSRACSIGIRRDRYSDGPVEVHLLEPAVADAAAAD